MADEQQGWLTVSVGAAPCRRCVRRLSRIVSDLPGVVSLQVAGGVLRISGPVDAARLAAALRPYRPPTR